MVLTAMVAAVAYLTVFFVRIPLFGFLTLEPKDVILTIGGFILGPFVALAASAVVSLVEMFSISDTGIIGCVMNFLSSCSFACTAAIIYKKRRSLGGAVLSLLVGTVAMVTTMLLWNYLITPLYMADTTRSDVAAMLIPVFLPFNVLKAAFNTSLTLLLYKPLVSALRRTGLVDQKTISRGKSRIGLYIIAGILLIVCILLILILQGKI